MMEKIDIFGISPRLYFQGKGLYQTKCGSGLTILVVISIAFALVFYGSEMFLKENPVTVFSEEYIRSPEKYQFKLKKNTIAIGLQSSNSQGLDVHFYDDSIYQFKFEFIKYSKFLNETTQEEQIKSEVFPVKSRKCIKDDFQVEGTQQAFQDLIFYPDLHCIDDYDAQDIEIEGDFGQDVFSYIDFQAYECRNSTQNNVTCKSKEEIDSYLNTAYWAIYFSDQLVNPKNYTYPFQNIERNIFGRISNTQMKEYTIYFKNIYIESDTGILWSSKEIKKGLMISDEKENTFNSIRQSGQFLNPLIQEGNSITDLDKQYEETNNEFNKIQEAFSAYKQIQIKEKKTNLDRKIVDMLDNKVKRYFHTIYNPRKSLSSKNVNGDDDYGKNVKDSQKSNNEIQAPLDEQTKNSLTQNQLKFNYEDYKTDQNDSTLSYTQNNNNNHNDDDIKPEERSQFKGFNKLQKQELNIICQQIQELQEELQQQKQQKNQEPSSNHIQKDLLVSNSKLKIVTEPFSDIKIQNINNNNSDNQIKINDSSRNLLKCQQYNSFLESTPIGEDINFSIKYDDIG